MSTRFRFKKSNNMYIVHQFDWYTKRWEYLGRVFATSEGGALAILLNEETEELNFEDVG